jgi:hypothetical protein
MKRKAKPQSFDESLNELVNETLGQVSWRIVPTKLEDGRQALVSVCGRFRALPEVGRRSHHAALFRAERRIEHPPGNWQWTLLSVHRTEAAAKAACERAARPPSKKRKPTSRPAA